MSRRAIELSIVFGFSLLLAVLWTYPLVGELGAALPGDPLLAEGARPAAHDGAWDLWWSAEVVAGRGSPYFSNAILYPHGAGLALHGHAFGWGLVALPLTWVGGAVFAAGVLVLFLLAAAATATWALARSLGIGPAGSALAALAWAFSPYFLSQGTLGLAGFASPWPPLFLLFLLRWMGSPPGREPAITWRAALGTGLTAGLCALCSGGAVLGLLLLGALVLILRPSDDPARSTGGASGLVPAGPTLLALATFALVALPFLLALGRQWPDESAPAVAGNGPGIPGALEEPGPGAATTAARGAAGPVRLLDFVTPQRRARRSLGALPLESGAPLAQVARGVGGGLFLGFSTLALAAAALVFERRAARWLAIFGAQLLLVWDPADLLGGLASDPATARLLGATEQLFPLALLPLALAAGMGLEGLRRQRGGLAIGLVLALVLPFEFWFGGYAAEPVPSPEAVVRIAALEGRGAVCVLPMGRQTDLATTWQTDHHKPMLAGRLPATAGIGRRGEFGTTPTLWLLALWGDQLSPGELSPDALDLDLRLRGADHLLLRRSAYRDARAVSALLDRLPGWTRVEVTDDVSWWRRTSLTWSEPSFAPRLAAGRSAE